MQPRVTLQLPCRGLGQLPCRGLIGRSSPLSGQSVLLIGYGYVAKALRPEMERLGADVRWTVREGDGLRFGSDAMRAAFSDADAVLISVPPSRDGRDPTLAALAQIRTRARWIGYLSATSVYGDRDGGWAFEGEAPTPGLSRGRRRADAELAWLEAYAQTHLFRLAGIYGPGRSPFAKLRNGTARVVTGRPGHVVNRIHVDDIVSALIASMSAPSPHDIFNIADGAPADPGEVMDFAAELLDMAAPERVALSDPSISAMARSFYAESKRVDTMRARERLNWTPHFPTFRDGLRDVLARES